ncbi:hypothetical protein JRQ81_013029 [Phrynocephalus forsythii]|uniref:Uncharacterized protein n=1 Tax=Phrynocephalus forsythii TaxID=171643 RepID=A0A9Q1B3N5_9SAUR|nr:hypothetical protein JRQ81_013029 [Phrynocephalus forsythii]
MSRHLQEMRELLLQLEQRGMEFTVIHKVYVILSSLSEMYDVLVTSLESMPERDLTLEYLTGRLLEEELKRNERFQSRRRDDHAQLRKTTFRSEEEQSEKYLL